ncbi:MULTISPECIES: cryptochrome/photolyase family protein [unclassified Corynebacterium]
MTCVMWFRDDLRLSDNRALTWASEQGEVVALVVDEPAHPGTRQLGGAAKWWRERSLSSLRERLAEYGVQLLRRKGDARTVVPEFCAEVAATSVSWTRRYHQPLREVDAAVKQALSDARVNATSHPGHTLVEPWEVLTLKGEPYRVYTPFVKAARQQLRDDDPLPEPTLRGAPAPADKEAGTPHQAAWEDKLAQYWTPGEPAARAKLAALDLTDYAKCRDFPSKQVTSLLSPHLRFGEISPREAWVAAAELPGSAKFHSELLWRDFAWHRLYHLPDLATRNVRKRFDGFDWASESEHLPAWQRGETGIPLVDAGMRELWETGYMHNRVRMVVGSFLTKNLGIHWRRGEEWFWETLVDADPASNPFNWQWVAGCGDDAAPFFRIFNPLTQEQKFDPDGEYVARWTPPLSPPPIVDVKESRQAALEAYADMKEQAAAGSADSH